ncbi:hypothetical protein [Streptomyces odontomachi]|uniref:hypothetical protein n=1 Tax=Streptomyces odontomachi TaxID=2944940 RepID=UPI002109977D|nr:hypothetical protein [Streptomyces sp. ODS25]
MTWWALVPVVTLLSGPVTLLVLKRAKRAERHRDEEHEQFSYQRLPAGTETGREELPGSGGRLPGHER